MNWTGSMSWSDEGERQRRRSDKPTNRKTVEIITCPTCGGYSVLRRNVDRAKSRWECSADKGCPPWFELPGVGDQGKAHIA